MREPSPDPSISEKEKKKWSKGIRSHMYEIIAPLNLGTGPFNRSFAPIPLFDLSSNKNKFPHTPKKEKPRTNHGREREEETEIQTPNSNPT